MSMNGLGGGIDVGYDRRGDWKSIGICRREDQVSIAKKGKTRNLIVEKLKRDWANEVYRAAQQVLDDPSEVYR